jgi:hypothetical protein
MKVARPPLDMTRLSFTKHALERFAERFPKEVNGDIEISARRIFSMASEKDSISDLAKIIKMLNNSRIRFEDERFFRRREVLFVVKEKEPHRRFVVLTVEKIKSPS